MGAVQEVSGSLVAVARNRRLGRLLAAFASFTTYEQMSWVAVLLWAYAAGGVRLAGVVAVVQQVPASLAAPLGSVLGDRLARGTALVLAYGLQAVLLTLTAVLLMSEAPTWAVVAAATGACCCIALTRPLHYSASPSLAGRPAEAVAANSVSGLSEGGGLLLGPLIAGVGTASLGSGAVLAGTALMAAASALLCLDLGLRASDGAATGEGPVRAALAGLVALRRDHPSSALLGLVGVQYLVMGALEILLVAYVADRLGGNEAQTGLLLGAVGVGGLVGAVVSVVLVTWRRLVPGIAFGLALGGVALAVVAAGPGLVAAAVLLALAGLGKAFFEIAGRTLLQRALDGAVLSRVFGVQESVTLFALAVGAAVAPPLVTAFGPAGAFLPLGLLLPVLGAVTWTSMVSLDERAVYRPTLLRLLRQHPFLRYLPVPALEALATAATEVGEPAGRTVVREGDPGDRYYLIEEGSVRVVGEDTPTVHVGAGDGFGEIALLRAVPRTATVVTEAPCRLWAIEREDFLAALGASDLSRSAAHREVRTKAERMGPDSLREELAAEDLAAEDLAREDRVGEDRAG